MPNPLQMEVSSLWNSIQLDARLTEKKIKGKMNKILFLKGMRFRNGTAVLQANFL